MVRKAPSKSSKSFKLGTIKNSVSNTYNNYTPFNRYCCWSRSSDDIRLTLSGPLEKFVDQLKKIY